MRYALCDEQKAKSESRSSVVLFARERMRQREKNFFCKTRFAFAAFDRSKAEYYLNAGIGGKPAVNRNGDAGDKSRRVIIQQEI